MNPIHTYVEGRWYVSTTAAAGRYQTETWEWLDDSKERGALLATHDSGTTEQAARQSHADICKALLP